jgi:5-methylcytosine-specific restriction endonuclease McrA
VNIHAQASEVFKEAKKHTKKKRKKLPSFSSLEAKLDRVFSVYIRTRDADEGGTVSCCTCGKLMHWKDSQCGHWIKRQHRATRWHPMNAAAQCPGCNLYKSGAMDDFAGYILQKHGPEIIEGLLRAKRTSVKHTRADLLEMIERFSRE